MSATFHDLCLRVVREHDAHRDDLARIDQQFDVWTARADDLGERIADLREQQRAWDAEHEATTTLPGTGLTIAETRRSEAYQAWWAGFGDEPREHVSRAKRIAQWLGDTCPVSIGVWIYAAGILTGSILNQFGIVI